MGQVLSEPITDVEIEEGRNEKVSFSAATMQGWRCSMEDAHIVDISYRVKSSTGQTKNLSYFSLFDGHSGSHVAKCCAELFPRTLLETCEEFDDIAEALKECFLKVDEALLSSSGQNRLNELVKLGRIKVVNETTAKEPLKSLGNRSQCLSKNKIHSKVEALQRFLIQRSKRKKAFKEIHIQNYIDSNSDEACQSPNGYRRRRRVSTSADQHSYITNNESIHDTNSFTSNSPMTNQMKSDSSDIDRKVDSLHRFLVEKAKKRRYSQIVRRRAKGNQVQNWDPILPSNEGKGDKENIDNTLARESESMMVPLIPRDRNVPYREKSIGVTAKSDTNYEVDASIISSISSDTHNIQFHQNPLYQREFGNIIIQAPITDLRKDEDNTSGRLNLERILSSPPMNESNENKLNTPSTNPSSEIQHILHEQIRDNDETCRSYSPKEETFVKGGSTALLVLLDHYNGELIVANAGDSRCVLSRGGCAIELSMDHKPTIPSEFARIIRAGGFVSSEGRINNTLNLSRAMGDFCFKNDRSLPPCQQILSPYPDVQRFQLSPDDSFLVMACDGIWECLSSQTVIEFISVFLKRGFSTSYILKELFQLCLAQQAQGHEGEGYGLDNMTAIIILLSP